MGLMIISKMEKKRGLMHISFEGGESLNLPHAVVRVHPLREGEAFDLDSYLHISEKAMYQKALERAVWWLSKSDCSEQSIMKKLKDAAFPQDVAERVCVFLKEGNYINDARLSENLVRQKKRGSGPRKIAMTLRTKGVDEQTAKEALASISDEEELEAATKLARKYLGSKRLEPQEARRKCGAYLARRGFGWDMIKAAYQRASGDELSDEDS